MWIAAAAAVIMIMTRTVDGFAPLLQLQHHVVSVQPFQMSRVMMTARRTPSTGRSRLFVTDSSLGNDAIPELDFNLDDVPPAVDFMEPLVAVSASTSTSDLNDSVAATLPATSTPTPTTSSSTSSGFSSRPEQFNQQPEYGNGKEMPNTYVRCGTCSSHFAIRPDDLGERGKGRYVIVIRFVFALYKCIYSCMNADLILMHHCHCHHVAAT